jgi:hypothetical protein
MVMTTPTIMDERLSTWRLMRSIAIFDAFNRDIRYSAERNGQCRRVIAHHKAPRTADAWRTLSEMIDLALGPSTSSSGNPRR